MGVSKSLKSPSSKSRAKLLQVLEDTSQKLIKCDGCTKCCEKGIAYVLPEERASLEALNVPLIQIDGITFIKRDHGGACAMLDKANKRCSIYTNRPFCCRAFPLDVFSRRGKLEWGVYTYCPPERLVPIIEGPQGKTLDAEVLPYLTASLEEEISGAALKYLGAEDQVVAQIEILDEYKDEFAILGDVLKEPSN
jgi:Fe-S-cluster containining protein